MPTVDGRKTTKHVANEKRNWKLNARIVFGVYILTSIYYICEYKYAHKWDYCKNNFQTLRLLL